MPLRTRPALRSTRLTALASLAVVPLLVCAGSEAATTIGSDLAGAPESACLSTSGCTATNLSSGGAQPLTSPSGGVVVRFRIKHGPTLGPATYRLKILSGGPASFALEWQSAAMLFDSFSPDGVDVIAPVDGAGRPRGVAIFAGQRIGAFAPAGVGFQSASPGSAVAEHDGDHASGTAGYSPFAGYEALINADIEPDADGDGYGDESQDNCPAVANDQTSNPCPASPPPAAAGTPAPAVTPRVPAGYAKPRIGRVARARTSLSRLSRGGLSVPIACYGACRAEGSLVMSTTSARLLVVGRGRRRSTTGGRFRLKVGLTGRGRRLLRRTRCRRVRLGLRASASDAWGRSARRQRLIVSRR